MNALLNPWLDVFGGALATLLNTVWISVIVAAAAWVVMHHISRVNAATRYAIWWAVLAAVVAVPVVHMYEPAAEVAPQSAVPRPAVIEPEPAMAEPAAVGIEPAPQLLRAHRPPAYQSAAPPTLEPIALTTGAWIVWVLAAWSAVFLVRMVQIGRSYLWVRGIKRRARPASRGQSLGFNTWIAACGVERPVRLLVSGEIASPMAVGFARPAVILPEALLAELTPAELDHILLHELAHIDRRDDWTNLLARLAGAVLALHPVALWVVHRIDRERELACDDWVVARTGEARPYAASLTRMFELCSSRRQLLASGMAETGSRLGERVERLLEKGRHFVPEVSMKALIAGTLVLLGLVVAGSQSPGLVVFAQEPDVGPVPPELAAPPAAPTAPAPPAPAVYSSPSLRHILPLSESAFVRTGGGAYHLNLAEQDGRVLHLQRESLLQQLTDAGYTDLTVDEIVEMARSGLSVPAMNAYADLGWTNLARDQMIELWQSGVSPAFVAALMENGFTDVSPAQAIEARQAGLRAQDVSIATAYRSDITLQDIILLKRAGAL